VAYQARCAVYIRDNVVYMVYLSTEPTSVRTLTESDILPNSFRITHTQTEDLATRHNIKWSDGEAGVYKTDPTNFEFTLKHNVPKYGIFDKDVDYYTLNILELVEKSATFWMIRNSNTWKEIEFETPLKHLNLDVFDAITINIGQFTTTKVVITESRFNLDSNTISFKAWTPIRSGEGSEYLWAWPSQQTGNLTHPVPGDEDELGDAYDQTVIPPVGHPLRGAYDPDTAVLNTQGDRFPSDLDDTLPTLTCKLATGFEVADAMEPVFDPFEPLAEENFADRQDGLDAGNRDGGSTDDAESKNACGDLGPGNDGCVYEVTVVYVTPWAITTRDAAGNPASPGCYGPCGCTGQGRSCYGPQHAFCHSFGSLWAANSFAESKRRQAAYLFNNCLHSCYATNVLSVFDPNPIAGSGVYGECEEASGGGGGGAGGGGIAGDPCAPAADAGQTQKPKENPTLSDPNPPSQPPGENECSGLTEAQCRDLPTAGDNPCNGGDSNDNDPDTDDVFVRAITMSHQVDWSDYYATARVQIMVWDAAGGSARSAAGATVAASWTVAGLDGKNKSTSSVTGTANVEGIVDFSSPRKKNGGLFTIKITGITLAGKEYNEGINRVTEKTYKVGASSGSGSGDT
jgi:hypothetical protein